MMAEPDAAGLTPSQGPGRRRPLTLADIQRDMERSMAPLQAAIEQAERATAPIRAAAEQAERFRAAIESGFGRHLREMLGEVTLAPRGPLPASDAPKPGGGPNGPLSATKAGDPTAPITNSGTTSKVPVTGPPPPTTAWSAEEIWTAIEPIIAPKLEELAASIKRTLAEPKKPPAKRGDTTSERLRALFEEDPEFAICRTLDEIGNRIGRKKSSIAGTDCHYYHAKLKPLREKKAAAVALAANDAARRLPSRSQSGRAMRDHRDWQAAVDDAIDRDGGAHLGRVT
jgi:hypothetical protein